MSGATLPHCGERSVVAKPDRVRVLSFTSAGGAKPIAGRGGLEGFTPPHRFKARTAASDGHCASTRAARSAGLRFAVILLSKAMDVGQDHLIHRKRSPFPYEGKALTPLKVGETARSGTRLHAPRRGARLRDHLIHRGAVPLPLKGKDKKALDKGRHASLIERFY